MRALFPTSSDDVDLFEFYGAAWNDVGGVRMDFISSVDGAVTVAGKSAGLQTPGDNRVFRALRDLADVIVAGAGTVRTERYAALHPPAEHQARRRALGYSDTLPTAVVSRRLDLDPKADLFVNAEPDAQTIVITCGDADEWMRDALAEHADVIVAGTDQVDLPAAMDALRERGLTRIVCEGGPRLFADLVAAGVVTELCLSISPVLAGPGAGRIINGLPWPNPEGLRLTGLLEEDGALFTRYRCGGGDTSDRSAG